MRRLILGLALAVFLPLAGAAQDQAALVADRIAVLAGNVLRAEGNVEILFGGLRLRASAITYDRTTDQIEIEGPMTLADAAGEVIFIADAGQLSADFRNGILVSARLVYAQRLQIAGTELRRIDGRYTELFQAVATTCPICENSNVPLWQIRASRIVHDQNAQRVYFKDAVFEVGGVPIFYVPRLRMPDGSVNRASGFLVPDLETNSVLGTGIKIPYFVTLGDHADVTLTPFISPETVTLGLEYRHLFRTGAINVAGAVTQDTLRPNTTRGYLFGRGVLFLPRDYELQFDLELVSDDSYLFDYGISGQDRTRSDLTFLRTQADTHFSAQAISFRSFRDGEAAETIPALVGNVENRLRFSPPVLGGTSQLRMQAYGLARSSTDDVVGRDYARVTAGLDWRRAAVLGPGLRIAGEARLDLDHFMIDQDSTASGGTALTTVGAVEVALPLARHDANGVMQFLEPKLQLVTSNATTSGIPNEESTLVEFDEGALWALDRVPGSTVYEVGTRLNAGVTWTRLDPAGWNAGLTFGRVIRSGNSGQFNPATGLAGSSSDWLLAGQFNPASDFSAAGRLLFNDDLNFRRNDLHLGWAPGDFQIDANFLWHVAEPEVGRDLDTWELHADANFPIAQRWRGAAGMRYDFVTNRAASANLIFTFESQCITADFGIRRTFTSSDAVTPKTDFTLALSVPPVAVASKRPTLKCSR